MDFAPSDPVQNVMPFARESTSEQTRSSAAPSVMIRGSPKMGHGGSSGWMARRTPAASATGTTRSRK